VEPGLLSAFKILLDTASFLRWLFAAVRDPAETVILDNTGRTVCVAFVSVAEAWLTALDRGYGAIEMGELRNAIERFRVLGIGDGVPLQWAQLAHSLDAAANGSFVGGDHDLWVAATARDVQIPLMAYDHTLFANMPGLDLTSEPHTAERWCGRLR